MIPHANPDPLGQAIWDYYHTGTAEQVWVFSNITDPESMAPAHFFRGWEAMPLLERKALHLSRGRILDIGAGAGVHAGWLANQGHPVVALEPSPGASAVLVENKCYQPVEGGWEDYQPAHAFDTILLLMNGLGLAGNFQGLYTLMKTLKAWLNPGGQVLMDSTDLRPLFANADRKAPNAANDRSYQVVRYQMAYKQTIGIPFEWLFASWPTIEAYAYQMGFQARCEFYGTDHQWLGCLWLPDET